MGDSFIYFRYIFGISSAIIFLIYMVVAITFKHNLAQTASEYIIALQRNFNTDIGDVFFFLMSVTVDASFNYHWAYDVAIFLHYCSVYVCTWRFALLSLYFVLFQKTKKRTVSMINLEWHKLLNPKTLTQNFFIRHKKTLGNSRYVRNVVIWMIAITALVVSLPRIIVQTQLSGSHGILQAQDSDPNGKWVLVLAITNTIMIGIPEFALVVITMKTPVFHDAFLVREEMKRVTVTVLVVVFVYLAISILHFAFQVQGNGRSDIEFILDTILNFVIAMLTSYWVLVRVQPLMNIQSVESLIKVKEFHKVTMQKNEEIEMEATGQNDENSVLPPNTALTLAYGSGHIGDMPLSPRLEHQTSASHGHSAKIPLLSNLQHKQVFDQLPIKKDISLKMVLKHVKALEAFMAYLAKEFSMEVGLSLCEFVQFERYAVKKLLHRDTLRADEWVAYFQLYKLVPLTEDIPKSHIVYGDDDNSGDAVSVNERPTSPSSDHNLITKIRDTLSLAKNVSSEHDGKTRTTAYTNSGDDQRTSVIPMQSRQQTEEILKQLEQKARLLWEKYVRVDSPYTINVSFDMRNEITDWVQTKKLDINSQTSVFQFISMFDSGGIEMFRLLINAFRRWKNTEQFSQLYEMVFLFHEENGN
ncbi:hypothetical protein RFI_04793 [Reticulomyxa filosa]|uniref:RGS domain-containing protein n=1 Tax=Reticulomyxa filosa TaxID=46433 RepID=X6P413_RETFI|nr:hypothetical protein RFI_04793 [Reticulomyxa filosa]|eukprot:ETO32322.1 hypothetical protein RFI_04793 [Reticulomyxa filosa]